MDGNQERLTLHKASTLATAEGRIYCMYWVVVDVEGGTYSSVEASKAVQREVR